MQITIPDDPNLQQRAHAAGFESIDAYVWELVCRDSVSEIDSPVPDDHDQEVAAEWISGFRAIFEKLPPSNVNVDDSRESIYPVR
jgi:hypothetical protein